MLPVTDIAALACGYKRGNLDIARRWLQVALDNDQPEAAYDIFRKSGFKIEALNVLVQKVNDMDRAHECAPSCMPAIAVGCN